MDMLDSFVYKFAINKCYETLNTSHLIQNRNVHFHHKSVKMDSFQLELSYRMLLLPQLLTSIYLIPRLQTTAIDLVEGKM